MLDFGFYNEDCLPRMKEYPDNYFDLAIVDPPYGDGLHAENGGGKGHFARYNQSFEGSIYCKAQEGISKQASKQAILP